MCVLVAIDNRFNDRLAIQDIVNYFFSTGGLVLTYFFLLAGTGFALTFYNRPTVADALESVRAVLVEVYS